jgi:chromosome segregation ATPase
VPVASSAPHSALSEQLADIQGQLQQLSSLPHAITSPRMDVGVTRKLDSELKDAYTAQDGKAWTRHASHTIDDLVSQNEELREANAALRTEKRVLDSKLNAERSKVADAVAEADAVRANYSVAKAGLAEAHAEAEAVRANYSLSRADLARRLQDAEGRLHSVVDGITGVKSPYSSSLRSPDFK